MSLSNESPQVPACEAVHKARSCPALDLEHGPLPVYIHFILWPRKSNLVALAAAGRSTARRRPRGRRQPRGRRRRSAPVARRATAVSKVRRIDSDREESSNWNETCLNNSLNVSFLAFQITRTVELASLLAGSQRTFCVRGACEGGETKQLGNVPLSARRLGPGWAGVPGPRTQCTDA